MTDAELRIVEFLMASDATRPDDLSDWMLALLTAQALIAEYAADPARLDDLSGRITAFRLAGGFERLRREGPFHDVLIDDPFDPEGDMAVGVTEQRWRFVNSACTPRDSSHGPHEFSRYEPTARPRAFLATKSVLRNALSGRPPNVRIVLTNSRQWSPAGFQAR